MHLFKRDKYPSVEYCLWYFYTPKLVNNKYVCVPVLLFCIVCLFEYFCFSVLVIIGT